MCLVGGSVHIVVLQRKAEDLGLFHNLNYLSDLTQHCNAKDRYGGAVQRQIVVKIRLVVADSRFTLAAQDFNIWLDKLCWLRLVVEAGKNDDQAEIDGLRLRQQLWTLSTGSGHRFDGFVGTAMRRQYCDV